MFDKVLSTPPTMASFNSLIATCLRWCFGFSFIVSFNNNWWTLRKLWDNQGCNKRVMGFSWVLGSCKRSIKQFFFFYLLKGFYHFYEIVVSAISIIIINTHVSYHTHFIVDSSWKELEFYSLLLIISQY